MLYSAEKNGYTIFKFTRPIKLCSTEDRVVEEGSPHVIFSWSDQDPAPGADISYHGVDYRGTKTVNLISDGKRDASEVPNNLEELHFPIQNVNKNNFLILLYKSKLRKLKKNLFRF